ncbi:MAG: NADH-quinone oxidoreductase subunit I [Opitutaceae bacterium]|nr:NADH-quinone oxidoreductase subunit I [Opitutaceae bacterium]|tara:strand:+ start:79 stop:456 length:378 start_codon:yes stop_codon:yes gene_type:complete
MESIDNYLPILIQVLLAVGMALAILFVSHLFGQRSRGNRFKDSPYECGLDPAGKEQSRFAVKFYVTAMLFILFDIEVVFMIPWVMVFRDFLSMSLPILLPMGFFLGVLVLGLVYELKKGALNWEN